MSSRVRFDYTTVGHVTADVMADGSRRPGGSAFYSALQAARLGQRALILTRGVPAEIEQLMEPYRGELELEVLPAAQTTTLGSSGSGASGNQRVLAWAGAMADGLQIDTSILHLAPVARETPARWRGRADFVGLTPQGLVRKWSAETGEISFVSPDPRRIPAGCDALVMSEHEQTSCTGLISKATREGSVVAVTAGPSATTILQRGEKALMVEVPPVANPTDDVGAGDVFAAAFYVALSEGRAPAAAAAFATAAAGVRIAGAGAGAIGDRTAIETRLEAVT
jgi:1D-myo-inositol 3-kinase